MIKTAEIVETTEDENVLGLFDKVKVFVEEDETEEEYTIVTTMRAEVMENRISGESPAGRALLGHPSYSYYVKILEITKGKDDENLTLR